MSARNRQTRLPGLEAEDASTTPSSAAREKPAVATVDPGSDPLAPEERSTADSPPTPTGDRSVAAVRFVPPPPGDPTAGMPESLAGQTVYAVDSFSLIFQVFHALPEMTSPSGQPVGAVFGFTRDMLYLLNQRKPDYLFCAFDLPGPTFRDRLYDQYKAHRKEMPIDLVPQIDSIRRLLDALEIPVLAAAGYEADDVLATVARLVDERGGDCLVVSGDKDCRQLLTERVKIFNVRKNVLFDAAALLDDWGIRPEQVVDFQALVGDPVDNVPGVPLIGPKLARDLLQKFGTLENLFEHVEDVAGKKRQENLRQSRELALLSRQLVRLDTNVPVAIDWPAGRVGGFDPARAAELFAEFGFHGLTREMRARAATSQPAPKKTEPVYQTIDTPERLQWLVEEMTKQPTVSFDTETTNISPRWAEIVGYSFSWRDGEGYYVPVRGPVGSQVLDPQATLAALRPVLENPNVHKIGQNLKYDMIVLRSANANEPDTSVSSETLAPRTSSLAPSTPGVEVAGVEFDTMVASYLVDAGERVHNLDELAARYLQHETTKISQLIGSGKNQKRMDEVPIPQITHYAAEDAEVVWRLRPLLTERLKAAGLEPLFADVEVPLIDVLAELEFNGIRVDVARLNELSRQYGERLAAIEQEIYKLAKHEFNIGSLKQLQTVLFDEQKLTKLRRTKTGASTDSDVLEELARKHPENPLPARIIEYRQYAKLKNTYVDALPQLVHPATGRVHASFNQSVAATGRLSSSDPNLQNIPIRTREGREIRSAFLPGHDGWKLLAADYSQIELRVLAHLSGDETMRAAFERDEDIHARVASQVYGVALDSVTPEMRRVAKAVNFGVIYGQSPFGLAKMLEISQDEAAEFIRAYFAGYPGVSRFLEQILADCRQNGYVTTMLGRRRAIQGVRQASAAAKSAGEGWPGLDRREAPAPDPDEPPDESFIEHEAETEELLAPQRSPRGLAPFAESAEQMVPVPLSDVAVPQRNLAERTAINTVIQGSAADLIKLAMVSIHRRLRADRRASKMLLQIHDELVFESPPDELEAMVALVRKEMSGVRKLTVPLKVDVKTGANWADCEPWA